MNKIYALLLAFIVSASLSAQEFEGTFKDGNDELKFENNKLYFSMDEIGSPMTNKTGSGTYERVDDYLIVNTDAYSGERSSVTKINGTKKDTITVKVIDNQGFVLPGVLVESVTSSNKTLQGGVTNNEGKVLFIHHSKTAKIRLYSMGYDNISFDYDPKKDYEVRLIKNVIVENAPAVFKIKKLDEETLSVLFLSSDFDAGKDQQKALEKINKKAEKQNYIPKRLKKEYKPYPLPNNPR